MIEYYIYMMTSRAQEYYTQERSLQDTINHHKFLVNLRNSLKYDKSIKNKREKRKLLKLLKRAVKYFAKEIRK